MRKYALLFLMLISIAVNAQKKINSYEIVDKDCLCPEFEWVNSGFQLKDIQKSENEMEIRLTTSSAAAYKNITVITQNEGKYESYFYSKRTPTPLVTYPDSLSKYGKWEKHPFIKIPVSDRNIDSVFLELVYNNVLNLPSQNEIYKKSFATFFKIEYKVNNHFRSYTFGTMKKPRKEFPDVKEYQQYANILLLFYDLHKNFDSLVNNHLNKY